MDYKQRIAQTLKNFEGIGDVYSDLTLAPNSDLGDFALPCFKFAKVFKKSPQIIAENLAAAYPKDNVIAEVSAVNGYLNFKINKIFFANQTISAVLSEAERYGASDIGNGKTVCIDYSSVNIAKPFHIGHLSTTVIGSALYKIYKFLGYNAVGINHLGDYGTQFGKLISAYKRWGNKSEVEKGGIHAVNDLYVRFNKEADEEMQSQARAYFLKIEEGDSEANELFEWFKGITLSYVKTIYERLNVTFDSYLGERFFVNKTKEIGEELKSKGLLLESEGAQIVDLEKYDMPPCLIFRSDGASLYVTRDLAAAEYRKEKYDFYKCLYVTAYQQNLHFKQLFKVLELMGKPWAKDLVHVSYGMVSLESGAMATRSGNVAWLEDAMDKSVERAYEIINAKNPELENKSEISQKVGIGAVVFGALYNNKIKDIVFSYDKLLSFDGETSVYVQYTCARANSILAKAGEEIKLPENHMPNPREYEVVKEISKFGETLTQAAENYEPSFVARFAVSLAKKFNKFYLEDKILTAEGDDKAFRLALTKAVLQTLTNAFELLGIGIPEKM